MNAKSSRQIPKGWFCSFWPRVFSLKKSLRWVIKRFSYWRRYINMNRINTWLAWERLSLLLEELYHVVREREVWVSLLILLHQEQQYKLDGIITSIKHPHNDESILITGRQLFMLFIPRDHLHCTCMGGSYWILDHFLMSHFRIVNTNIL